MQLKTYHADSMADALAAVKHDLGHDAVILHTRTFRRGGLLGLGRRTVVEVTATPAEEADRSRLARSSDAARLAAGRAYAAQRNTGAAATNAAANARATALAAVPATASCVAVHPGASALLASAPRNGAAPATATEEIRPRPRLTPPRTAASPAAAPAANGDGERHVLPVAQRYILQPAAAGALAVAAAAPGIAAVAATGASATRPTGAALPGGMQEELAAIRQMVGQVLRRQGRAGGEPPPPPMPERLFDLYLQLTAQELDEELAERVIAGARAGLDDAQLDDAEALRAAVLERLAAQINVADEPVALKSPDARPLTIALVGPTGVGKTTTLAKLAASFKLRHGRRVGLVTADTYRIAAVDQLRTYANIIGLPLQVVLTPPEMGQAVHSLADCDVILVDTAGRSQNDEGRIAELRDFIEAASPHEVHLVLSSTAGEKVLMQEAEAFATVGVDKIAVSKVDEAVCFGPIINVLRRIDRPLSFLTTGQEVPDHIERARPERLADLLLGGKVRA